MMLPADKLCVCLFCFLSVAVRISKLRVWISQARGGHDQSERDTPRNIRYEILISDELHLLQRLVGSKHKPRVDKIILVCATWIEFICDFLLSIFF